MDFPTNPTQQPSRPVTNRGPETQSKSLSTLHKPFILGEFLMLVLLLVLAVIVHLVRGPLLNEPELEVAWQHLVLPHQTLTQVIDLASTINWPNPALIGVIAIVVVLLLLRRWIGAFIAGLVSGLGDASSYLTNQLVQRPRPTGHGLYIQQQINTYYSFPSGHVVHVIGFFGFVLFLTFQTKRLHSWWLWLVRVPLIALIVLVGPSRLLEGEHWPTDVLGGLLLGGFWLVLGIHAYNWLHRQTQLRHRKPFSSVDETSQLGPA